MKIIKLFNLIIFYIYNFIIFKILIIQWFTSTKNSILCANIIADLHSSWSAKQLDARFTGIESMTDKEMNPSTQNRNLAICILRMHKLNPTVGWV